MDLTNIIVATDLSDNCSAAARWAQALKERTGASHLYVAHVIELSVSTWVTSAFEALEDPAQRGVAERKVADWFQAATGTPADGVFLRAGSCLPQFTEIVGELTGATLLVVAMSGKSALKRLIVGSTARILAGQPPCALAIVHPDHAEISTTAPVVTGTDLSVNGNHATSYAAGLAQALAVPLDVVHAYGAPSTALVNLAHETAHETTVKVVTREIEEIPALEGVDARIHVLADEPGHALIARVGASDADIVVVGHSGESLFVQNVMGSVAHRVVGHLPCTTIIVPGIAHLAQDGIAE